MVTSVDEQRVVVGSGALTGIGPVAALAPQTSEEAIRARQGGSSGLKHSASHIEEDDVVGHDGL